jgi:hypothetical protein
MNYSLPVNNLLTLGDVRGYVEWRDYLSKGLTAVHIPELIRMATDDALNYGDPKSLEVWAPVHAWRALAQLRAVEAIEPLISQFKLVDELSDDYVSMDFPQVFSMIGPQALKPLSAYISSGEHGKSGKICATECIGKIGETRKEQRKDCIDILTAHLRDFEKNARDLNGFLIWQLGDLKAVESLEIIRKAYESNCVDIGIVGDLEDVEILLGARKKRDTPKPRYNVLPFDDYGQPEEYRGPHLNEPKISRNDLCPCGSGKKYKKCCLKRAGGLSNVT